MLDLLKLTGLPLMHIVLGFGSDGESTEKAISDTLARTLVDGTYKGCFSLVPMVPLFHEIGDGWLSNRRTTVIICNAIEGKRLDRRANNKVKLNRGIKPIIPIEWLSLGFVFDYNNYWQYTPAQ